MSGYSICSRCGSIINQEDDCGPVRWVKYVDSCENCKDSLQEYDRHGFGIRHNYDIAGPVKWSGWHKK
jgi:hypothetical protein